MILSALMIIRTGSVNYYVLEPFLPVGGMKAKISFHGRVRKCMM